MRKLTTLLLASVFFAAAHPVLAQDWRGHDRGPGFHEDHGHGDEWHWHGDIHAFGAYDYDHWRGGRWYNGFHEGRNGWWWIVDGYWYFYPAPVYPFPDPYTPPTVVVEGAPGGSPAYYYCGNPAGYYPYVPECYGPWQRVVTATPPAQVIVQQPAPQPMAPPVDQHAVDYQKLNTYAAEFQSINPAVPGASKKLKNLLARVEAFRKSLYHRGYNAMDVMENAEDLHNRIAAERNAISKHQIVVQSPTAPAPVVTPLAPPSGYYGAAPQPAVPQQQQPAMQQAPQPPGALPPQ